MTREGPTSLAHPAPQRCSWSERSAPTLEDKGRGAGTAAEPQERQHGRTFNLRLICCTMRSQFLIVIAILILLMAVQPTVYSLVIKMNCTFTCIFLVGC